MFVRTSRPVVGALLVSLAHLTTACTVAAPHAAIAVERAAPIAVPASIRVRVAGRIQTVPLEEYVIGTALSEVSPINENAETVARIFAVQSVIARTYAVSHLGRHRADGFDLCDSTHCQIYEPARLQSSRFSASARAAVAQTRGRVLAFSGRPLQALFHADCGGHTADASSVWGGAVPYLTGTPDEVPGTAHRTWEFSVTTERLRLALNRYAESRVGRRLRSVRVIERDDSGRATEVEVAGEATHRIRGERLRTILNEVFGARALMSARFMLAQSGGTYRFAGSGFGHGVGLCQVGAAARARRGESLEAILGAYFPGASLSPGAPTGGMTQLSPMASHLPL